MPDYSFRLPCSDDAIFYFNMDRFAAVEAGRIDLNRFPWK